MGYTQEIGRGNLGLQATHASADEDVGMKVAGVVYIGGEMLLHAYGRAAATDIACEGKELLHGNHLTLLVARHLGGKFEVYRRIARNHTHEVPCAVTLQDECLEYLCDILAQRLGHMWGAEVVLVNLVGDEFVGYLCLVE